MINIKIFKRLLYNGSILLRQEKPAYKLGENKTELAYKLKQDKPFKSRQDKPFKSRQDKPFKSRQDKPFKSRQDKPFKSRQDKPFKSRQDKPFKSRQDKPFKSSQDKPFKSRQEKPAFKLRQGKTEPAYKRIQQDKPAYYKDADKKQNWEPGTVVTRKRPLVPPQITSCTSRSPQTPLLKVSNSKYQFKARREESFRSEVKNNFSRKCVPSLLNSNFANEEEAAMLSTNAVKSGRRVNKTSLIINRIAAEKMVLYKDDDMVVLNKPSGLAVHSGPRMKDDLSHYLHYWRYGSPDLPQLAHRLDKDTSGILLLTRHIEAARRLAKMFQERMIIKKYWAVTVNVPDNSQGSVKIPLAVKNIATGTGHGRHSMNRVVLRQDKMNELSLGNTSLSSGVQVALTEYKVLSVSQQAPRRCCLLEVKPVTGFKHQIRVHLADGLMCPILGDYKFAGPLFRSSEFLKMKVKALNCFRGPLHLHARELIIPNYYVNKGKPLIIQATPPGHFVKTAKLQGLELGS